jgi:PLP dependent protein
METEQHGRNVIAVSPDLRQRYDDLLARIAAVDSEPVQVLAVTKGFDVTAVRQAKALGLEAVGENYSQELLTKATQLAEAEETAPDWHFIGRLQRNKIRPMADLVTLWQTIDRVRLIDALANHAPNAAILIQVNVSGESQKGGCAPADVEDLVSHALDLGLDVQGLMTVGVENDAAATLAGFKALRAQVDALDLAVCSMGMSNDLEAAIGEGSTMIRVGTALFGPRTGRG